MKLLIDRKKWYRGQGGEGSSLLREDGKMCCVGFYSRALGLTRLEILNVKELENVNPWDDRESYCDWEVSDEMNDLYITNDEKKINETDRESNVAAIFAEHGVTVTFKN